MFLNSLIFSVKIGFLRFEGGITEGGEEAADGELYGESAEEDYIG